MFVCVLQQLDPRLRTTSDPFAQTSRVPQRNAVAPGYGRRAESSEDVWWGGGGRVWGEREDSYEEPDLPARGYSPA